jgi:hypothetical protein
MPRSAGLPSRPLLSRRRVEIPLPCCDDCHSRDDKCITMQVHRRLLLAGDGNPRKPLHSVRRKLIWRNHSRLCVPNGRLQCLRSKRFSAVWRVGRVQLPLPRRVLRDCTHFQGPSRVPAVSCQQLLPGRYASTWHFLLHR